MKVRKHLPPDLNSLLEQNPNFLDDYTFYTDARSISNYSRTVCNMDSLELLAFCKFLCDEKANILDSKFEPIMKLAAELYLNAYKLFTTSIPNYDLLVDPSTIFARLDGIVRDIPLVGEVVNAEQ